jgi:acyl-phosphate glycerol 3-phosphate acyltransferase
MAALYVLASLLIGYVLGSVPSGVILVRVVKGRDLTKIGNRRIGAANVYREVGLVYAVLVWTLDMLKVIGAAVAVTLLGFPEYCVIAVCVAAIFGHSWSVFLRFQGGEGVAVTMGANFYYFPLVQCILFGVYLLFCALWALKIRPFYRYHAFSWQSVFCCAPFVLYLCGDGCVMSYAHISFTTALVLSGTMALAGLVKQARLYGVSYLFRPYDSGEESSAEPEGAAGLPEE